MGVPWENDLPIVGFPLFHIYVSLRESNSHHSPFLFTVMTSQSGPTKIDPSIPHDIPAISSLWMIPSFHLVWQFISYIDSVVLL